MTFEGEQIASNRTRLVLQLCLIVAMTMVAYFPALNAGFIWDDDRYVTNNPLLTAPDGSLIRVSGSNARSGAFDLSAII